MKVEGTLREIRSLFISDQEVADAETAIKASKAVRKVAKRTKSAWQRYMGQKKNQIKYKSGPKKGRLDLSKMSRAYKRSRK